MDVLTPLCVGFMVLDDSGDKFHRTPVQLRVCYGFLYNRKHENKITVAESDADNSIMTRSTISARIGWMFGTIDAGNFGDSTIGVGSDTGLEIRRH